MAHYQEHQYQEKLTLTSCPTEFGSLPGTPIPRETNFNEGPTEFGSLPGTPIPRETNFNEGPTEFGSLPGTPIPRETNFNEMSNRIWLITRNTNTKRN
ncbi:MAG: hypothetical protein MRJ93_13920 [Nitrososphaeraceae archaeon]|nr:hypothetical protein [Nitrososphaeraceae archaeon]